MESFWNKISDLKLSRTNDNIETYDANMKISIKKIKAKDDNELFYYKYRINSIAEKIYDIIEDNNNNILYIIYDSSENIDELINNSSKENKEAVMKEHCEPIQKCEIINLFEKEDAMCKIKFKKIINNKLEEMVGTGFFIKLNDKDIPFNKCLITNNHVLSENNIKKGKEIKIEYLNKEKIIKITDNRKVLTDKDLDYTCIEILKEDKIKNFFKVDENAIESGLKIFEEKDIFILQYPKGNNLSFSNGKILSIRKDNKIIHNCSTEEGSSGSPIISRYSDYSIIGLHYGSYTKDNKRSFNLSTSMLTIIQDIKHNINNYITCEINIDKNNIYEEIRIINSYKEKDIQDDYLFENEKEISDNCEITINNKKIEFKYYYIFNKEGKYIIKYSFLNKLKNANYIFCGCKYLTNFNFLYFHTQNITNMGGMFYGCESLTNLNLSNFNTQNVTNMGGMFGGCQSLTSLNLSNFNTQNVTNMAGMFRGCQSLTSLNLSNFNTQNLKIWIRCFVDVNL